MTASSKFDRRVNSKPITQRSRTFRQRVIPVAVWGVAIAVFVGLNQERAGYQFAVGIVEVDEVAIAPLGDGTVLSLGVDLFDYVEAGEIIAMMDDTLIVAELAIEEAQLGQIRAELNVERKQLENNIEQGSVDQLDELRRYQLNEEQAHLEYLELGVEVEADRVKLERLKIQMDRQSLLLSENVGVESSYDDIRLRHKELEQELTSKEETLMITRQNANETTRRRVEREDQSSEPTLNTLLYLEPYLAQLKVQEARREEISQERLALVLRAPIDGQVAKVFYGPGETVLSGTPMVAIQNSTSNRVIAYVDEHSATTITSGTEVELRSASRPRITAMAKVLRKGSSLEEMPSRVWSTPIIAEWGFPILIGDVPEGVFLPGETVNVRFEISSD